MLYWGGANAFPLPPTPAQAVRVQGDAIIKTPETRYLNEKKLKGMVGEIEMGN